MYGTWKIIKYLKRREHQKRPRPKKIPRRTPTFPNQMPPTWKRSPTAQRTTNPVISLHRKVWNYNKGKRAMKIASREAKEHPVPEILTRNRIMPVINSGVKIIIVRSEN